MPNQYEKPADFQPTVPCFVLTSVPAKSFPENEEDAYVLAKEYPGIPFSSIRDAWEKIIDTNAISKLESKYATLDCEADNLSVGFDMPDIGILDKAEIDDCFKDLIKLFEKHLNQE